MTVLVDTSVIVDHLRNDPRATRLLADLFETEDRVWAATPTRTEVLAGVREHELPAVNALFDILAWVEVDTALADAAGLLANKYLRSHRSIDTVDYLIAAATMSVGARLVTLNVRHFPMFEGLQPAYG